MSLPFHYSTPAALLVLAMKSLAAGKTLFDFQTTTNTAASQIVNDGVMGGISVGTFGVAGGLAVFRG